MTAFLSRFLAQTVIFLALLGLGIFVGSGRERRHLKRLRMRELQYRDLPATTGIQLPGCPNISEPILVHGGVVISVDYFKRLAASFRSIIGGRLKAYESLLSRARREAVLRMKQSARQQGADAILNVRIETSSIANGRRDKGVAGVEILAFGTGVRTR